MKSLHHWNLIQILTNHCWISKEKKNVWNQNCKKNSLVPMLTFLKLRDPLHEGVESALSALAVGRSFIVELALLFLQLSYLPEELGFQCPQTLAQQLAELRWQRSQGRGCSGWWICAGKVQALLLGGTPQTEIRDRQALNPSSHQCSRLLIRQLCYLFGSIVFDTSIS